MNTTPHQHHLIFIIHNRGVNIKTSIINHISIKSIQKYLLIFGSEKDQVLKHLLVIKSQNIFLKDHSIGQYIIIRVQEALLSGKHHMINKFFQLNQIPIQSLIGFCQVKVLTVFLTEIKEVLFVIEITVLYHLFLSNWNFIF
jgi:hypothetical protein